MLSVTHFLNAFLMLTLPLALWLWLARRWRLGWRLVGLGALMFIGSQVVHLPLLYGLTALFQAGVLPAPPAAWAPAFNIVVLSLLAGLCEETARYIGYRWLVPEARTWRQAVVYGAGHGGIEAILFGGLALAAFVQLTGLQQTDLSTLGLPAGQQAALAAQVQAYWSLAWPLTLLGAVERVLAITLHITLSVLVLQAVIRRRWGWWAAAVGWHALANAVALGVAQTLGAQTPAGMLGSEAALALVVALGLVLIFRLRAAEAAATEAAAAKPPSAENTPARPEPAALAPLASPEKLDDTRYLN